jgi:hypothetical protein
MSQHPIHADPTTGSALTSSDAGHPHLGIWRTGKFDQPRPQVLLKGATRQRRPCGQLLAGVIGYIPDRDGLRHGSSLLRMLLKCKRQKRLRLSRRRAMTATCRALRH